MTRTIEQILEEDYFPVSDLDEQYDESLDSEGTVLVGGLEFYPSRILSELDPIAYRCGYSDFVDSLDLVEHNGECYNQCDYDSAESDHQDQFQECEYCGDTFEQKDLTTLRFDEDTTVCLSCREQDDQDNER